MAAEMIQVDSSTFIPTSCITFLQLNKTSLTNTPSIHPLTSALADL